VSEGKAWLRRNLGQANSNSGYVPTYVSKNGTVTVGPHVGGAPGTEALPMEERFGAPRQLTPDEMKLSAADQILKLDGVAPKNISDGVKYAARAIKCGTGFDGPTDAIMRAAMIKDPAQQAAILKEAGINSVAELRARLRA
jgi:hypothetical protein